MSTERSRNGRPLSGFGNLPASAWMLLLACALIFIVAFLIITRTPRDRGPVISVPTEKPPPRTGEPPAPLPPPPPKDGYLLCFWNLENFFDDQFDDRHDRADAGYDRWFARDPDALRQKLDNLTAVLTAMNDGRGPDILAMAELESRRAAELLQTRLNEKLPKDAAPYRNLLFEMPKNAGRHIAPAILTRLDVDEGRTRVLGDRMRLLEGHILANGHDLAVIASHWSSRVSDHDGARREKYAAQIYLDFVEMYEKNPKVALLVCGDFNDNPDDPSVRENLYAIGRDDEEVAKVRASGDDPYLLNLFPIAKEDEGTLVNRGRWFQFDQIVVSPGLLDGAGWSVVPGSAEIWNKSPPADARGRPHRFGNEHDKMSLSQRGYSDHFPVTVRLKVAPAADAKDGEKAAQ